MTKDGCSNDCLGAKEGYLCIEGMCLLCGGGTLNLGEDCDDGNRVDGDGCSSKCKIEKSVSCGNGIRDIMYEEECDDGNKKNSDGCSHNCLI